MSKIFIRADSNEIIASGHIMRTKSIAQALLNLGAQVAFITSDEKSAPLLQGFENIILNSTYNNLNDEIPKLCTLLQEQNTNLLLIDSYFITPFYLKELKKYCKTAYIDDLNTFTYNVNILICYDAFLDTNLYKFKQNKAELYLLGGNFAPLREEFVNIKPNQIKQNKENFNILLTSGNADTCAILPKLLQAFSKESFFNKCKFLVVSGIFNTHKDELINFSKIYKNIEIFENVKNMATLMQKSDIAISAAGSTLYELAASGVATICIRCADNQKSAEFWGQNAMIFAGDAMLNINEVVQNTILALKKLINNPNLANKLASNSRSLINAQGANLIAKELLKYLV